MAAEEYGRYVIQKSGRFEYDENLDGFYNYAKYGSERIKAEVGLFTSLGYVAYRGTVPLLELRLASAAGLAYTFDGMGDPEYGNSTSVEITCSADGGAAKNGDVSKNAALAPLPCWQTASASQRKMYWKCSVRLSGTGPSALPGERIRPPALIKTRSPAQKAAESCASMVCSVNAGEIVLEGLEPGATITAQEVKTVDGFVLDGSAT